MSRKNKNIIDVAEARDFIFRVYGLKSKIVNEYHLRIVHPELRAWFNWYHTKGTLTAEINDGNSTEQVSLGKFFTDEDTAIKICGYAMNLLQHENCPYYREKRPKHSPIAVSQLLHA